MKTEKTGTVTVTAEGDKALTTTLHLDGEGRITRLAIVDEHGDDLALAAETWDRIAKIVKQHRDDMSHAPHYLHEPSVCIDHGYHEGYECPACEAAVKEHDAVKVTT